MMEKDVFYNLTTQHAIDAGPMSDLLDLSGQVAVVTGGGGSLGFLVANRLAEAGASVVLSDFDEDRGEYALEGLKALGRKDIKFVKADVRNLADMERVMDFTVKTFGRLDICVNSAAYWSYYPTLEITEEEWAYTIDTVLTGTMNTCRSAAKTMKSLGKGGKIVAIGSDAAINCEPPLGILNHYAASKAGAMGFAKSFAREVHQYDINVNMVLPGAMTTIGARYLNVKGTDVASTRSKMRLINEPMSQTPDDVARVIFMMCTQIANFMYGAEIVVDGGSHIRIPGNK